MAALRDLPVRLAMSLPFRCVVAAALLAIHCATLAKIGHDRFSYKFNEDPLHEPLFYHPEYDSKPDKWDRLVVARWDSQHYEGLGLRGYSTCKDKAQLASGEYPDDAACVLAFYPTYGFVGAWIGKLLREPIDYTMFGISLVASFALILMWTGRTMVAGLGLANTWLSLLLLNAFTTGFQLVTVQTEPSLMALTMATFICLQKRWLFTGAIIAGAAASLRVTGVVPGLAFSAALALITLREHPRPSWIWVLRGGLAALSLWGVFLLMAYYWHRFGDPFIYSHAHARAYHNPPSLAQLFFPDGRVLLQSIWAEPNDGVILAAVLVSFAVGHRKALTGFSPEAQVFWYVLFFGIVGISMYGSAPGGFNGSSRYMVTVLPVFFAMAAFMRRRPVVLGLWLIMSTVHYYNASECFYVSQNSQERLYKCAFPRYFRTDQLGAGEE